MACNERGAARSLAQRLAMESADSEPHWFVPVPNTPPPDAVQQEQQPEQQPEEPQGAGPAPK
jgi:hypothetical protein